MRRGAFVEVVRALRAGQPVILPTDTAYALAADATQPAAIRRVQRLKGRAAKKPIALLATDRQQVERAFRLNTLERRLARRYWPGPLTLVLTPRPTRLATAALSPSGRVGVRVPRLPIVRRLLATLGRPVTATSANRSGERACYTVRAAQRSLGASIPALDIGWLPRRRVSTVCEVRRGSIRILRPGPIKPQL